MSLVYREDNVDTVGHTKRLRLLTLNSVSAETESRAVEL